MSRLTAEPLQYGGDDGGVFFGFFGGVCQLVAKRESCLTRDISIIPADSYLWLNKLLFFPSTTIWQQKHTNGSDKESQRLYKIICHVDTNQIIVCIRLCCEDDSNSDVHKLSAATWNNSNKRKYTFVSKPFLLHKYTFIFLQGFSQKLQNTDTNLWILTAVFHCTPEAFLLLPEIWEGCANMCKLLIQTASWPAKLVCIVILDITISNYCHIYALWTKSGKL